MTINEAINDLRDGRRGAAHDIVQALCNGERLGQHAAQVHQWYTSHPSEYVRELLTQAWALHSLQVRDVQAVAGLIEEGGGPGWAALVAVECFGRREAFPKGTDEVLKNALKAKDAKLRWRAASALRGLPAERVNWTLLLPILASGLRDHTKADRAQVSHFFSQALYSAIKELSARDAALEILKVAIEDEDKKTAGVAAAAYAHALVDAGDFAEIDRLLASQQTAVRAGVASGMGAAILAIPEEMDLGALQRNLVKGPDGKLKTRQTVINARSTVGPFDFPAVLRRLIPLLEEKSRDVQGAATSAIRTAAVNKRLNIAPAAKALTGLFDSRDPSIIQDAVHALGRAVRHLEPAGVKRIAQALFGLLRHENGRVRQAAADTLSTALHLQPSLAAAARQALKKAVASAKHRELTILEQKLERLTAREVEPQLCRR